MLLDQRAELEQLRSLLEQLQEEEQVAPSQISDEPGSIIDGYEDDESPRKVDGRDSQIQYTHASMLNSPNHGKMSSRHTHIDHSIKSTTSTSMDHRGDQIRLNHPAHGTGPSYDLPYEDRRDDDSAFGHVSLLSEGSGQGSGASGLLHGGGGQFSQTQSGHGHREHLVSVDKWADNCDGGTDELSTRDGPLDDRSSKNGNSSSSSSSGSRGRTVIHDNNQSIVPQLDINAEINAEINSIEALLESSSSSTGSDDSKKGKDNRRKWHKRELLVDVS